MDCSIWTAYNAFIAVNERNPMVFKPDLTILPPSPALLWSELDVTPGHFTLYGGTALALRLGHRRSADFDFFSNQSFEPLELARTLPYLKGAEHVQVAPNTLVCRVERDGHVLVSFFGGLGPGQAAPREQAGGRSIYVASLLDVAGTKVAVDPTNLPLLTPFTKRPDENEYAP